MMKTVITEKRILEIIKINKWLACLVVVLALALGYVLAVQEQWLVEKQNKTYDLKTSLRNQTSEIEIVKPTDLNFTNIWNQARYRRDILPDQLSKEALDKILWSAQGIITEWGERTVPSYKSSYPVTLWVWVRNVENVAQGWYQYDVSSQKLVAVTTQPSMIIPEEQPAMLVAPIVMVISIRANLADETSGWLEAGGIMENILVSTSSLALATYDVPLAIMPEQQWDNLITNNEKVATIMPVGKPQLKD